MNVVISGATGFIGQYVCQSLKKTYKLSLLVRNQSKLTSDAYKNIDLVPLSLSDEELRMALQSTDAFIHLAAQRPEKKITDQSIETYFDFIRFTNRILSALKESSCKQIINISTKSVYGKKNIPPFTESQIPYPSSHYGLSKLLTEQLLNQFVENSSIRLSHLRLSQVIGWGEKQANIVTAFLNNAINKNKQQVWGNGVGARTYVYVKDVVNTIETALQKRVEGSFNIGWPEATSHSQMAEMINKVFGNPHIEYLTDKPEDISIEEIDTNKAKNELGWRPSFESLECALMDMKKDYEKKTV